MLAETPPKKTTVLEQKRFLRGVQRFEFAADGSVDVTFRNFSVHRQFKIPLKQIHPEWERIKYRAGGALLGTCVFGTLWIGTLVGAAFIRDTAARMAILCFPGTLLAIPFVASLVKLKTQAVDCVSFPIRNGGALHIWFDKPDSKTFQEFCAELSKRAREAAEGSENARSQAKSLAAEIDGLAKLRASGILSESEFAEAKARLIESIGERKIGFR
jgi:hypothetical protein